MAPDDELEELRDALAGVTPLDGGPQRVERRRPRGRRAHAPSRSSSAPRIEVETWGEYHQGLAARGDSLQLRKLEAGEWKVDRVVDLHGESEESARLVLLEEVRRARRAGQRVLRVVHGRGLRSAAGPILRNAVRGWLGSPPLAAEIVAFTSAGPLGAAGGATVVLLRPR